MREPDIQRVLRQQFGFDSSLTRLAGEGESYACATDDRRLVLKIAAPETTPHSLELEFAAAAAIERMERIRVPQPVPTSSGNKSFPIEVDGNPARRARLLTWVEGTPWTDAPIRDDAALERCGQTFGEIAVALGTIPAEVAALGHRTHRWDLANAASYAERINLVDDPARRRLLYEVFAGYTALYEPQANALPQGLIHGDLNDSNLYVEDGELVGVIDFGDVLWNPMIADLAIALAYLCLDYDDPFPPINRIVRGYHIARPLVTAEVELLWPLICTRLATSVLIAAERRRIDPDRAAWFVTETAAWAMLQRYGMRSPAAAADDVARGLDLRPFPDRGQTATRALDQRRSHSSAALSLSYDTPIKFIRGRGTYLIDDEGQAFLDLYNNVAHVGHCHPRVVAAGQQQMAQLNTNSRYLSDLHNEYCERLCATLPDPLSVCFLVNSGSEANELALRLARSHTGSPDLIVLDNAYHGHTTTLIDASPYKTNHSKSGYAPPPWRHVAEIPDPYRGRHREHGDQGRRYGAAVGELAARLDRPTFLAESLICCGGQVIPPQHYFATVFGHIRQAGGVCILDEVQTGFGRVGTHFWAFELQRVVPDIVVMGKPIGNGHPMSAVVCTREIARSFEAAGIEYFATFGGNPVSCAVGLAVLDVLRDEQLQQRADRVGRHLLASLQRLAENHQVIGDVRGRGLFAGIELVTDRATRTPNRELAHLLVQQLRDHRVLTGTDGPWQNVIKIKPPLVVTESEVNRFVELLDQLLNRQGGTPPGMRAAAGESAE